MSLMSSLRSPALTFCQTLASLLLSAVALLSSYWCEGRQKMPKPLCSAHKSLNCIPMPGLSSSEAAQFSWETGDDRFVFPSFHSGLWTSCEENIYKDEWEEKCRSFMELTPRSEKGILWLSVSMELTYMSLLSASCVLLLLELCVRRWLPSFQRLGPMLNAFSAVFTVLGGLLGMVAHMMFMQVFQTTASMGPEGFKPHSYGYSWAFYVAWVAYTFCMFSGVCTLNNYTRDILMPRFKRRPWTCPSSVPAPTPFFCPPPPPMPPPSPPPPPLSPLSPYYSPPCDSTLSPHYPPSPSLSHASLTYIPQYYEEESCERL